MSSGIEDGYLIVIHTDEVTVLRDVLTNAIHGYGNLMAVYAKQATHKEKVLVQEAKRKRRALVSVVAEIDSATDTQAPTMEVRQL